MYSSMYGYVHRMAEAIAEGVKEDEAAQVILRRVPETNCFTVKRQGETTRDFF